MQRPFTSKFLFTACPTSCINPCASVFYPDPIAADYCYLISRIILSSTGWRFCYFCTS